MTKILVIGKSGQVGSELVLNAPGEIDLYTSDLEENENLVNYIPLDLCDTRRIKSIITELRPDIVINAAAYTAVDKAETEKELAMKVNAEAPKAMAEAVKEIDGWLIHYSTDYVYDGTGKHARLESEATNPVNFYGHSKLEGEKLIRETGVKHITFRTSWVFSAHGHNFVKTMLRLGQEREELSVVDDQIGSPTSARLIAAVTWKACEKILRHEMPNEQNLYHLCGKGLTSWHGFTDEILKQAKDLGVTIHTKHIKTVSSEAFKTAAVRPKNSRLDCSKLEKDFFIALNSWKDELHSTIRQLKQVI